MQKREHPDALQAPKLKRKQKELQLSPNLPVTGRDSNLLK